MELADYAGVLAADDWNQKEHYDKLHEKGVKVSRNEVILMRSLPKPVVDKIFEVTKVRTV